MFKISASATYTTPVTVELPGSKQKSIFDAEFRRLSQQEVENLMERAREGGMSDAAFVREVMVGWNRVNDESGELEFSAVNLDKLLAVYPVAACIIKAYTDSLAGARLGN